MLRTFVYGLGRKVAPDFNIPLRFIFKICHAFRARTSPIFFSLRGYGGTHANKGACTHFRPLYTLRGAKVRPSFLLFGCAFVPSGSPRNPARQPGRTCPHKVSSLDAKRVPRISFAFDERQAFARVIPPIRQVSRDRANQFLNSRTRHSFPHARFTLLTPTILAYWTNCRFLVA